MCTLPYREVLADVYRGALPAANPPLPSAVECGRSLGRTGVGNFRFAPALLHLRFPPQPLPDITTLVFFFFLPDAHG
jgi:hypothetical protein